MKEAALLTGPLERTNEPYTIAKLAGVKFCESYKRQYNASYVVDHRNVMPANLYVHGDNFYPANSQIFPALIRHCYAIKVSGDSNVTFWGAVGARREFLFVDDMAPASVHVMNLPQEVYATLTLRMQEHINVG